VKGSYDYKKVVCTCCGWRGRRGYRVSWPACPSCGANANNIVFEDIEDILELKDQLGYHRRHV
jgi:ribosomal protein L37E